MVIFCETCESIPKLFRSLAASADFRISSSNVGTPCSEACSTGAADADADGAVEAEGAALLALLGAVDASAEFSVFLSFPHALRLKASDAPITNAIHFFNLSSSYSKSADAP
ncbi:hypothetical protein D3C75_1088690 [compost metagenome]